MFPPWGPSTLGLVLVYQHGCSPIDSSSLGGWRALHPCVEPPVCPGQGGHCGGTPYGRGRWPLSVWMAPKSDFLWLRVSLCEARCVTLCMKSAIWILLDLSTLNWVYLFCFYFQVFFLLSFSFTWNRFLVCFSLCLICFHRTSAKKQWKRTAVITWWRSTSSIPMWHRKSKILCMCQSSSSVTNACLLLMGVIYAVNLSYPLKLKYTFEVFQKLFLELDVITMSPKVQFLHNKLLAWAFQCYLCFCPAQTISLLLSFFWLKFQVLLSF